jgi:lysophospholipase
MTVAPYHTEVSGSKITPKTQWRHCLDGVRVRVSIWTGGTKGTIIIFPGRTEFLEKYGAVAEKLLDLGYCVAAIDWRGQGIADRIHKERQMGHVEDFVDYQQDVAQLMAAIAEENLPKPYTMLAHSMGGAIGLRALHEGLDVEDTIFSGPMWGIYLAPAISLVARITLAILPPMGFAKMLAPTRTLANYVEASPFKGNTLTSDKQAFELMQMQMKERPELGLGGPSVHWLAEATTECAQLVRKGPAKQRCLCLCGQNEKIVDTTAIDSIMARWENGQLIYLPDAQHEVFMENPETLAKVWTEVTRFLAAK